MSARERRVGRVRSALDDAASRRLADQQAVPSSDASASEEEERTSSARPGASGQEMGHANRQAVMYCPYCAEETLFPLERGWECRSCLRAFSVAFLGLASAGRRVQGDPS